MYQPIHSDFLIHWTGKKDIDEALDPDWHKQNSSEPNPVIVEPYLKRLKSILKHGLWMNEDGKDGILEFGYLGCKKIKRPVVARTCFTELKLSEAREHAKNFGRLGIGFKRMFLFNRLGRPIVYYGPLTTDWFFPPFFNGEQENTVDEFAFCFMKPMIDEKIGRTLKYNRYDESEWRIIYSSEIKERLVSLKEDKITKYFCEPGDVEYENLIADLKQDNIIDKPKYLIPIKNIDGSPAEWLSMIIYPNLAIKVAAEADDEIRGLIKTLKPDKPCHEESIHCAWYESFSKPIEIDLDACRNF